MKQCNFCTKTEDRVGVLFKGILNAYICDQCLKSFMYKAAYNMIGKMNFVNQFDMRIKNGQRRKRSNKDT